MFVWAKIPKEHLKGKNTIDYSMDLVEICGSCSCRRRGVRRNGEGYVRIALVENEQRLRQAVRNIKRFVSEKPVGKN